MTSTFHSSIHRAGEGPVSGEREARERDEDPGVWVAAVTDALTRRVPVPPPEIREAAPAPADGARFEERPSGAAPTVSRAPGAGAEGTPSTPERLVTELSDSRLGRLELNVARGADGLLIVINVADTHVKALIEADRGALLKSLQDCGLRVASMRIGDGFRAGTALARQGEDGARLRETLPRPGARRRAYQSSPDEAAEDDGVDFVA